ncbi:hypothetical protein [Saccharothrix longispora]|uniref:hypothetical protein n=1 Tax=Saccharothrix longispora TaxID=33920 RepID=UPI0028FD1455|nr:hypothetical protein [Saccharothrix longispora]MDU0293517.1 hypothetical protein [Saccharothrix longispora]
MLDVPRPVVEFLARLLAAHRRAIGPPSGSRALGPFRQAVLVLRWFRDRGRILCRSRSHRRRSLAVISVLGDRES